MINEFFGINGYQREPEGFLSWQQLVFATFFVCLMAVLAVWLGLKKRSASEQEKNKVLIVTAITMDLLELIKIVLYTIINKDPDRWLFELPLFLCSIQMISLPVAAFAKGRLREAALDFVSIFGVLGALMGTYAAGNIYAHTPLLSFPCIISAVTHCISGFAALYIFIAGLVSMKQENICITFGILLFFCTAAYIVNQLIGYNYMFLSQGDGTPYDILYDLVGGSKVWYPVGVVVLFLIYITLFYAVYHLIVRRKAKGIEASV